MRITSQAEIDALPEAFPSGELTVVEIDSSPEVWVEVRRRPLFSEVLAVGQSCVMAIGFARIVACDHTHVEARDDSSVVARGFAYVWAHDRSCVFGEEGAVVEKCSPDVWLSMRGDNQAKINYGERSSPRGKIVIPGMVEPEINFEGKFEW